MRALFKATCVPLVLFISACQPSGLYDQHGNYHSADTGYEGQKAQEINATEDSYGEAFTYSFGRPGFYDYEGNFVQAENVPEVPDDFLPPEGMCRVYHPDKALSLQAPAKACRVHYHIPAGAYVIYGG